MYRNVCTALGVAVVLAGSIATVAHPPSPRLLWNVSASAPIGLWRVNPDAQLGRGDMVAARLAAPWRGLAARRHYLPANVPLIKRVAAVADDRVCSIDGLISVNGRIVATQLERDGAGRAMPHWDGCTTVRGHDRLLLMDDPASFDGRYFGVTASRDVIGKATPLWLR